MSGLVVDVADRDRDQVGTEARDARLELGLGSLREHQIQHLELVSGVPLNRPGYLMIGDAEGDADADGFADMIELALGSDPLNPGLVPDPPALSPVLLNAARDRRQP